MSRRGREENMGQWELMKVGCVVAFFFSRATMGARCCDRWWIRRARSWYGWRVGRDDRWDVIGEGERGLMRVDEDGRGKKNFVVL